MPYDSRMHGFCLRCKKSGGRNKCTKLCDQAEHYANQDYTSSRALSRYIGNVICDLGLLEWAVMEEAGLSKLDIKMLLLFHSDGLSYAKIAWQLANGPGNLRLTLKAVERRLARARARLRGFLSIRGEGVNHET